MVMLAVTAGLRRSELFGLQWEDVNFHEMQISMPVPAVEAELLFGPVRCWKR